MAQPDPTEIALNLSLRMGDSALILGQQLCAWCGHAPELEEDIALTNIALDLIGQAALWLDHAGALESKGRNADELAFLRHSNDYRNLLITEQPNSNYADTMMRQFLFDAWHLPMLQSLCASSDLKISEIARKAVKEVTYHLDRSSDLVIRLGDGSEESHRRMQKSLENLWLFTGEMITHDDIDRAAIDLSLLPEASKVEAAFEGRIARTLALANLEKPEETSMRMGGKSGRHGEALGHILAEMQHLQRSYPGAVW